MTLFSFAAVPNSCEGTPCLAVVSICMTSKPHPPQKSRIMLSLAIVLFSALVPLHTLCRLCSIRGSVISLRIPAQLLYAWLAQLSAPALAITQVKCVLPQLSNDQPRNEEADESSTAGATSGACANSPEDAASGTTLDVPAVKIDRRSKGS